MINEIIKEKRTAALAWEGKFINTPATIKEKKENKYDERSIKVLLIKEYTDSFLLVSDILFVSSVYTA